MDFVYDGKDQLRRATKKQAGAIVGSEEYWYDDTGQRITILKRDANGTKSGRIQFRGEMEVHYDQADVRTHSYLHLSLGTPVARVKRTSSATMFEYMFHGLGNHTLASVSSTGATDAAFSYTPFGEVVETDGSPSGVASHRRRFNDKYDDDLSDLSYYGARYYDRTLIGWSQSDPLYSRAPDVAMFSSPRRANQYQFSLSNPIRYVDPDGLDPVQPKLPEAPQTLMQRQLTSRMADQDWTMKFSSAGGAYSKKLAELFDTGNCGGGRWCNSDDDELSLAESLDLVINLPARIIWGRMEALGTAIIRQNQEGNCGNQPVGQCSGGPNTGRDALEILGGVLGGSGGRTGRATPEALCFAAGTPVHTEVGLQPIEEIQPGTVVWATDETTGEVGLRRVVRTFATPDQPVVEIALALDDSDKVESIRATLGHPFWTQRGWIGAQYLQSGDRVLQRAGAWLSVVHVNETQLRITVYNLEVDGFHTYFVGEYGALVHNNGCKTPLPTMKPSRFGLKIADEVPVAVPKNWSRAQIGDAITDYTTSIAVRKAEQAAFRAIGQGGTEGAVLHAQRITREEFFLRQLEHAHGNRR